MESACEGKEIMWKSQAKINSVPVSEGYEFVGKDTVDNLNNLVSLLHRIGLMDKADYVENLIRHIKPKSGKSYWYEGCPVVESFLEAPKPVVKEIGEVLKWYKIIFTALQNVKHSVA